MTDSDRVIYLDNNATTAVDPEVREAMRPFVEELYGNPSSMHTFGGQVRRYVDTAREQVAELVGARPDEIIFTACGTESDNAAIRSALATHPERRHIVTSRVEHPAVLNVCQMLSKQPAGWPRYRLTQVPVDSNGMIDPEDFEAAIDGDDVAVASIMWANNEMGDVYDVERMARAARERDVLFHTDAVQAVGKLPIDLSDSAIDMLSLSGHKLHAPKGIGALYVRKGTRFNPYMIGGHQERNRRGGTEAVPLIVALGKAAELARQRMDEENSRVRELRDRLEKGLLETCPGAKLNGHPEKRLPNTTNISFEYVEGESILLMLDQHGICASSGSACTSGSLEPSHVMRAMGVPYTAAHGSVRFSLSVFNTNEDVDKVLEVMPGIIKRLRDISPFGREQATA